jgi:hypothetical protein
MPNRTSPLVGLVVGGLAGFFIIYILFFSNDSRPSSSHPSNYSASGTTINPKDCLSFHRNSGQTDDYSTTITGTITNNCGRSFSYVEVTFKLFDGAGNVIGTALANQTNLSNGETWKFSAIAMRAAKRDTLDTISAY